MKLKKNWWNISNSCSWNLEHWRHFKISDSICANLIETNANFVAPNLMNMPHEEKNSYPNSIMYILVNKAKCGKHCHTAIWPFSAFCVLNGLFFVFNYCT